MGRYPRLPVFLKTLTLKGFKSFADPTVLDFQPGITVVVGPNGSGKSNIVDAIAWVLGAQGAKALRSGKMEDVIFAGSAKRPALGRAEVSLTIDNSSGVIPIDFTEVTITRTLFRTGESEYAINGVPCRLLDVQELLSDAGVGRQQHVIVGQGQLAAVLDARPEDRRAIIEEAAGVLKFRKRREKAQRRLEATEGNLLRLQDLLREVRRQLRPLERQAEAARRHGDVVAELQALRRHLAGRELGQLRQRNEVIARTKAEQGRADGELRARLASLDADVLTAEAALSAQGGDELGDALFRAEGLRERAKGAVALLAERRRSVARDLQSSLDQAVVASLESDAARIASDLSAVEAEAGSLVVEAESVSEAEAALAGEQAEFEQRWGDASPVVVGDAAAEVRGELSALRGNVERGRTEAARLQTRLASLEQRSARIAGEAESARGELAVATSAEAALVAALDEAETQRVSSEAAVSGAEGARSEADADRSAWQARAEALALALDQARARAGAERLAGVDGVVGTLLDLVDVDEGWEAAFEAAIGEALAAVVVDGVEAARRALSTLRDGATTGAVLALETGSPPASLGLGAAAVSGLGAEPVRAHVRSGQPAVEQLLDRLLADAVAVEGGWELALDLAMAHPGLVAVTKDGDRFAATGWRAGAGGVGATGAALEEARTRAVEAAERADAAAVTLGAARESLTQARSLETERAKALDANDGHMAAAADALQRLEREDHDLATESEGVVSHLAELTARLQREELRLAELDELLPALEAEEEAGTQRVLAMRAARSRLEDRARAVAALRNELEVRAAALEERRGMLTRRLAEVEERLRHNTEAWAEAQDRRVHLEATATATERLGAVVARVLADVETVAGQLRTRRERHAASVRAAAERLDGLRRDRSTAERQLGEVRERLQRAELEEAEVRVRLEQAVEGIRREFDCEPEAVLDVACPELPGTTTAPNRVRELERDLRLMGPINPLALEEFTALQERHEFLEAQLEDVKSGRRELAKVIRAIDTEIVDVFTAAYADVAENFASLFQTLFPGGAGKLRLTDPDNPLETGIEVEARPSGKSVKRLSLLSGGERSLTALAYLFAVFRSRPSPFYLLDEVEAALDDVNLHRFLDLINEFREEAQLVVVSHQKRTMEAADCLYGVTMVPGGSSKVVSERITVTSA